MPDTAGVTSCPHNPMRLEHSPILQMSKLRLAEAPEVADGRAAGVPWPLQPSTDLDTLIFLECMQRPEHTECLLPRFPQHRAPP